MNYEILSPAGTLEKLKIALLYGADAVYFGGENYNLRANSENFSINDIKEAVNYAHNLNKKVYVTLNMIFHNDDLLNLDNYLKKLDKLKVDAVIVSDLAVIKRINDLNLKIKIHISTQQSICNKETVKFFENLKAERVVLARESSKEDIKDIYANTNIELEAFIHGAMCTSYSGRCVLSNYITLRDSNRGGCAQVCRFSFNIEDQKDIFSMSSKDLNMVYNVVDMVKNGIYSLKIEGRMRSIYYIATVVNAYKNVLTKAFNNTLTKEVLDYYSYVLNRCANRETAPQFYDRLPLETEQYFIGRKEESNQDFLAIVVSYDKLTKTAIIEQRNNFKVLDEVEVFGPNKETITFKVKNLKTLDEKEVLSAKHPQELLKLEIEFEVEKFDIIRTKL